jgi:cardiolipin synthase
MHPLTPLAQQAFSRAAGAPLVEGNRIRLLEDARENYPAWLEAIASARDHVHFESYIIYDDDAGKAFADALLDRARHGVRVRVLYDWMGALGKSSGRLWSRLRAGGVEVRCYNPPGFASPLGWLSRDHRKTIVVDGCIGVVAGLCVGDASISCRSTTWARASSPTRAKSCLASSMRRPNLMFSVTTSRTRGPSA